MRMKKFTSSLIALAAALAANATVVDFTYNRGGNEIKAYGFNRVDIVNVAIRINDPAMVGSKVTGISVPVTANLTANTLSEASAFLSTNLKKDGKKPAANICMEEATVSDDGILTCTFSEPYTITEEGVYVGYSMNFTALSQSSPCYPIAVAEGTDPDGLYVFSSRSITNWVSKSESIGYVSAMTVTIDGDFAPLAASISTDAKYSAVASETAVLPVKITNVGTEPVTSFDYSYTVNGTTATGSTTLSTPLEAVFGAYCSATVSVPAPAEFGTYPVSLTLTKLNGQEVKGNTCEFNLISSPFIAHNRPLVEEFTGLWCGNCPRGYAALETLREEHPNDFVALAYHDGDPMAVTSSYPVSVSGFPSACVNRATIIDPSELYGVWPSVAEKMADSNVEVKLSWANEEKTILRATVSYRFLEDQNGANYKVGAALVADGLRSPSWGQSNYFSSSAPTGDKILDELFVGKPSYIYDLPFNDVMLSFPNMRGVAGKLPAEIKKYEAVTYTEDFDLNAIVNLEKIFTNPIQNIEKLRVVGVLFDKNGKPLNSASSAYSTAGGKIDYPTVDAPVVTALTPATADQPAEITFVCPTTYDGKSGILTPNSAAQAPASRAAGKNYFYVSLFVDGKPYTFTPENYPGLTEDATAIVFGDTGIGNTSFTDGRMTIKVFDADVETLGVQTRYVTSSVNLDSEVTTVDATVELAIESVSVDAANRTEAYYDLQGRRINAPAKGRIAIRKAGSKTEKIIL